jgi:hypothetical protein
MYNVEIGTAKQIKKILITVKEVIDEKSASKDSLWFHVYENETLVNAFKLKNSAIEWAEGRFDRLQEHFKQDLKA